MLIGIPPLLGPDLLYTLRAMGHGDEIALVDGNYPAQEHARRLVRADGHGVLAVMEAILAVTIALVTVYDMVKSADKSMIIGDISLIEKTGGKSGPYHAP